MTKTCIYPGCDRPAVPAHALGGPQPSFCDLEEHNALTAHQRRMEMAGEAYRAVFLRVHPTGKMVLSLTTEADGHEGDYAKIVAEALGVPALDVKVVPADEDRFGSGHGYNTAPSPGTSAAITSAAAKILAKAQLLAGAALDTAPDGLRWENGAFGGKTIADIALYAHGTGPLPPGVEGGLDAQTVYRD
jgi:aerobic carbon-monoxide dehydrogenase large subunit